MDRSNLRGRGRLCMRGDEAGSFLTVILGAGACELRTHQSLVDCCISSHTATGPTYGDDWSLLPGEPWGGASWVEDIRGEEFAGADGGGKVGQFLGLGSRVVCGEDNGAAVADATAVDMVEFLGFFFFLSLPSGMSSAFGAHGIGVERSPGLEVEHQERSSRKRKKRTRSDRGGSLEVWRFCTGAGGVEWSGVSGSTG